MTGRSSDSCAHRPRRTGNDGEGGSLAPRLLDCRLHSLERVSSHVAVLRVAPPAEVRARAGQFAMLRPDWGVAPLLARPMSIMDVGATLSFVIRERGEGTRRLAALAAGSRLSVLAPLGTFFGEPRSKDLVLVAGGVGVAPLVLAAREARARGIEPSLLYGARTSSDLALREDLERFARLEVSTDDGSAGRPGPVTALLESAIGAREGAEVWACGPEPMLAEVARLCSGARVRCKVSVEAPMACGFGLCLGCARRDAAGKLRYVCCEGPVFDAAELYGEGDG